MDKNNEREVLATTKEAEPAQVVRTLDDIASELEDAAIPYEGDFADTVRDCAEELRALATSPAPSVKQEAAYDHLVIALGKGLIEVGQGHEGSERLPAILFGRNGAGAVGIETEGDRIMKPGECIAAITFGNVESLDVVAEKIAELRARIWPDAAPSAS